MAKIQCKMCGGELTLPEGVQSGTCEYCGSLVTFPKISGDQMEQLYNRAEHFRRINEYDKAVAAYEKLIDANPDDAEAYWGLVLCRYGIEYVEDPATHERIPTCHRVSYDSILADADYLAALERAGSAEKEIYEAEAKRIAEIQKGILAISSQEEPFDIFICYKESDDSGKRTRDSVAAQEIYYALTEQGYKVFFARITLEKKLGQQYEPYIFAALNSAKAMLVIGSKPEYFNAVWVRNEWSRFLALMKKDRKKLLIPCYRDMDAYDIPEELSMFQAQDMGKIGFIQDLLHGIAKVAKTGKAVGSPAAPASPAAGGENPLLVRAQLFVENGDFASALDFCEKVLNTDPKNGEAYFCRLLAELQLCDEAKLIEVEGLEENKTFKLAQRFADNALKSKLDGILQTQAEVREAERQRQMRIAGIRDAADERIKLLDRYLKAEMILHGSNSELYDALYICREAEKRLSSAHDLEAEPAVRAATEEFFAQAGDLTELERLVEEKLRQDRERPKKIGLIVAGAVVLLIIVLVSCNAISKRNYINAELTQARAAMRSAQWSEAIARTENVLRKDANNAEAKNLLEEARREEAKQREEAKRLEEARREEAKKRLEEEFQKSLPGGVLHLSGDVKLELLRVKAGTFAMGAYDGENSDNEKEHRVTLTRDFYLGKTEVTQAQWRAVMGNNPSRFKGDDLPVENVSWNDAMAFCKKLNEMGKAPSGWQFTLPTEAQWEYAARGGRKSRGFKYSGSGNLNDVAWYYENSGDRRLDENELLKDFSEEKMVKYWQDNNCKTHPVASKKPNELGLYDMSGNVLEWCRDWYEDGYARDPEFLTGNSGSRRVRRGGDWRHGAGGCRSAFRYCNYPGERSDVFGFRLAFVPVQ